MVTDPGELVQLLESGGQLCVCELPEMAAVGTWLTALDALNDRHTLEVLKLGSRPTL